MVASADMTFGTVPPELSQALGFCESALMKTQYLHGDRLTSLDKEYYDKIAPNMVKVSPLTHPHTFAWFSLVFKFSDAVKASWPKVESGAAAPAPKAAKAGKAEKKKDKPKPVAMSLVMLEVKPLDD